MIELIAIGLGALGMALNAALLAGRAIRTVRAHAAAAAATPATSPESLGGGPVDAETIAAAERSWVERRPQLAWSRWSGTGGRAS